MAGACVRLLLSLLLVLALPAWVGAQAIDGTWKLSYISNGTIEQTAAIVKLQSRDGKVTGELVAASPRFPALTLKSVAQEAGVLRVVLQVGAVDFAFESNVPKQPATQIRGVVAIDANLFPAELAATEETTLDQKTALRQLDCPPLRQAMALAQKSALLRFQAQKSKDPDQKKDLLKDAALADLAAVREAPKLYRQVIDKHADSPAVLEAALRLIRSAQANDAKPEEVKSWAAAAAKVAQSYGPRLHGDLIAQVTGALISQENYAPLAAEFARQAEQSLTPTTPAAVQVRVLTLVARALRKAGPDADVKAVLARIDKFDAELDREYLAKMPPFKAAPFAGRKSKSDRAVFMELFTGATCPPCVAADLAFDVLMKTYKPAELVLIQYHMHIPGPDPLTNPDSEARWAHYRKAFPGAIGGVPSSLFNGKPAAGGGGGTAAAEKKYVSYCAVIDPLLDEPATAKLTAQAHRKGDRIEIHVEVADLKGADPHKKLRILLAEETIRYAGSNKIRFHHNVVRAFPGGVEGTALIAAASKHTASLDLAELRGTLTKYLDSYEADNRPFANPARPLDLKNLRVIAFVQDDATQEILQAVQVEVEGK